MTLKLDRHDVCKLMIACTMAAGICEENANESTDESAKALHLQSAESWRKRRDELKAQLDEWDAKHPNKS